LITQQGVYEVNIRIPSVIGRIQYALCTFVLFIWQLPQHIAAGCLALYLILTGHFVSKRVIEGISIYDVSGREFGVSLGNFIFIGSLYRARASYAAYERTCKHERGHQYQSLMLGPLYLFFVGIPSAFFNVIGRVYRPFNERYYKRYPEAWADRLGQVNRV